MLLRRVGALVQDAFLYTGRRDDVLSQLLRGLAGTALTRLELVCRQLPAGNGSALAQLTGLRCLQLGVGSPLPQSLPALPPALRELAVDSPTLPSLSQLGILASAQPAAQLTSLTLRSNSSTLPPLQPLTALTRLRELECVELHGGDGGLPLLPTSAFPSLSRMAFVAARGLLVRGTAWRPVLAAEPALCVRVPVQLQHARRRCAGRSLTC